ncbi:chromosome condensation protein CrcB [Bacillus sp. FJAT-27231]|uniref:fluoride efflux transporter CrcB n=1 Tax=Bacillus sp. FJAT-27231 TaxID=1679168 RepID=UPI0006715DEA|nr:fluoride efflux transporter CrcB [Bacillus sp. FJAT-27231]KMY55273.1 chromosome condensation protein CrcB [Bacillus sp. FJAT-27231]
MIWFIGIGGALGAISRFLLGNLLNKKSLFPAGTWLVNVTGSFLLGWLAGLHLAGQISEELWLFGGVGFCGAYTTFSTFGYETITLLQSKKLKTTVTYVTTSLLAGGIAAAIGLLI